MTLNGSIVLVVEDDESQREPLSGYLADLGARVLEAASGEDALAVLASEDPDVVITDLRMPGIDGRDLLRELKKLNPEIRVLVVTAYGTVENAVACLKDGADDYLLKPLDLEEVEHQVRRAVASRHLLRENRELKARLGELETIDGIVTAGGPMSALLSTVARVAPSEVSVLLLGESGTGKELLARAIHAASPRRDGPFVAVNGAALSATLLESELFGHERGSFTGAERTHRGRFERASGGTLFLDEVGDLPPEVQLKLLRVLQERVFERVGSSREIPTDVRIVSATNRDLPALVASGDFREDLYYRLAVVTAEIPPLRERRSDIPLLVEHFTERAARTAGVDARPFSREAMDLLVRYAFPGNVRELENIVQRGLVLARGDHVSMDELPLGVLANRSETESGPRAQGDSLPARVAALERHAIEEALASEAGNQSRAAALLGISERALRYKMAKWREKGGKNGRR